MFFRRKQQEEQSALKQKTEIWSEKTQEYFQTSGRLDIHITSVVRRWGFGGAQEGEIMREPDAYEVNGIIKYPGSV
jgi:thiamine biosynthesis lipoprotein ApbE